MKINKPPAPSAATATAQDYIRFHGMLCSPSTAKRCIESFGHGRTLFASQSIYDRLGKPQQDNHQLLTTFDWSVNNKENGVTSLSVVSYYLLVLASFTGLCSLLRRTKLLHHKQCDIAIHRDHDCVRSTQFPSLSIPNAVIRYLFDVAQQQPEQPTEQTQLIKTTTANTEPSLRLVQRFEFSFGSFLSVMMLHFVSDHNGRKGRHLVETYEIHSPLLNRFNSFCNRWLNGRRERVDNKNRGGD